jgi:hypothetical protein
VVEIVREVLEGPIAVHDGMRIACRHGDGDGDLPVMGDVNGNGNGNEYGNEDGCC